MNHASSDTSRREFMLAAGTAAAGLCSRARGDDRTTATAPSADPPLPTRRMGRSGIRVSVLNLGTAFDLSQRLLDHCWDCGVRYFDTADCYPDPQHIGGSEREIAKWFERTGRRKDIFLVTKCHPGGGPKELPKLLDERLTVLKTDYVDLLFIHAIKFSEYGKESLEWVRGGELKTVAEKMKKSGKARLVGFTSHDPEKHQYVTAAAEGGFVDACMIKYDPRTTKNDDMNRALDKAHKAGIGIIAMKTQSSADAFKDRWEKLHKGGLSVQQAIIKAVLADERLTGATSQMSSVKIIDENTTAARDAKPLAAADHDLLLKLYAAGPHRLCEQCNDTCGAGLAGAMRLHDLARIVMYHDVYGDRRRARELLREIPRAILNMSDEEAAHAGALCRDHVDYAAALRRARELAGVAQYSDGAAWRGTEPESAA